MLTTLALLCLTLVLYTSTGAYAEPRDSYEDTPDIDKRPFGNSIHVFRKRNLDNLPEDYVIWKRPGNEYETLIDEGSFRAPEKRPFGAGSFGLEKRPFGPWDFDKEKRPFGGMGPFGDSIRSARSLEPEAELGEVEDKRYRIPLGKRVGEDSKRRVVLLGKRPFGSGIHKWSPDTAEEALDNDAQLAPSRKRVHSPYDEEEEESLDGQKRKFLFGKRKFLFGKRLFKFGKKSDGSITQEKA